MQVYIGWGRATLSGMGKRATAAGAGREAPRRRPGRPPGNTTAATRALLLKHARAVFAERGYEGASTTEIVERAGLSPSVLYHHFGSKATLYTAALAEVIDIVVGAFEQAAAGRDTFPERLDAVLEACLTMYVRDNVGPFMVTAPMEVRRHAELSEGAAYFGRMRDFFDGIVSDGVERDVSNDSLRRMCTALLWGLTGVATTTHDESEFASTVAVTRQVVAGSFQPRSAPRRKATKKTVKTPATAASKTARKPPRRRSSSAPPAPEAA